MKVIVTIDDKSYILVTENHKVSCEECSLFEMCIKREVIGRLCLSFDSSNNSYFRALRHE